MSDHPPYNPLDYVYATYRDDKGYLRGIPGHAVIGPPEWVTHWEKRLDVIERKVDEILEALA